MESTTYAFSTSFLCILFLVLVISVIIGIYFYKKK